ncbi:hypothetical protein [Agromyces sp. ZXT2-6]|uniref:hypothetical protein n=1 Tax=Agromyces sp. ZXT2-6 TaxID=3461153 RepID=UPI004054F11A
MTRTFAPRVLAASAALTLSLGLAACAGNAGEPAESASPTTPAAASPEPTTEPTPTDTPAIGTSCEDVLAPEAYAQLEADGLEPRDLDPNDPIIASIAEEGGLVCSWGKPQSDIILHVAQASGVDEAAWGDELTAAGYAQTDDPVPGAWTGPVEPGSGLSPVVVLADGTITFVSAPTFAQWVRPAS